ncbi:MAG: EAL domain-containing protein [Cellvibrionaceae bacterium]
MENKTLFARQPIFNRQLEVAGYELLCRDPNIDLRTPDGQDAASSGVLMQAFNNLSIHQVVGRHKAFINFTENLLHAPPLFGKDQLVIEVLESVIANPKAMAAIGQLRAQGYTVALDDFELSQNSAPLLEYAQIVKIDVLALTRDEIASHVEQLKPLGVTLLAEKVEDKSMMDFCKDLGFELYQGYYLSKPKNVVGNDVEVNKNVLMQMLATLNNPDASPSDLESIIAHDPIIGYKMLRLINSNSIANAKKVNSLHEGINILGMERIRRWATLLSLASQTEKPLELSTTTLTRARMCQLVGTSLLGEKYGNSCFTIGLFSTLHISLGAPLEFIVEQLPFTNPAKDALLEKKGPMGKILADVIAFEQGEWHEDSSLLGAKSESVLADAYSKSMEWVTKSLEASVFG